MSAPCARTAAAGAGATTTPGQLGDGTTDGLDVPVPASGIGHLLEIAAGNQFTCARRDEGTVWCWGDNHFGQLGGGTAVLRATPVAGRNARRRHDPRRRRRPHLRRLRRDGGRSPESRAGAPTRPASSATTGPPIARCRPGSKLPLDASQLAARRAAHLRASAPTRRSSAGAAAARARSGRRAPSMRAFRSSRWRRRPLRSRPATRTPARSPSDGAGSVLCWGADDDGQLGDGTLHRPRPADAAVPGEAGVISRSPPGVATPARWTATARSPAGGATTSASSATAAPPIKARRRRCACRRANRCARRRSRPGRSHTCALAGDGRIFCWGRGDRQQLGGEEMTSLPPSPGRRAARGDRDREPAATTPARSPATATSGAGAPTTSASSARARCRRRSAPAEVAGSERRRRDRRRRDPHLCASAPTARSGAGAATRAASSAMASSYR